MALVRFGSKGNRNDIGMSGLPPIADIDRMGSHVRFLGGVLKPRANEGARFAQCCACLGQDWREDLPVMRQPRPDFQRRRDARLPGVI